MKFNTEYQRLRKERGLKQTQIRDQLRDYGIDLTVSQLSKLENNKSEPSAKLLFALCEILKVDNPREYFSDFYKPTLNEIGMRKVAEYKDDLIASGRYCPILPTHRKLPLYYLAVSAGTGQFLDGDSYEEIDVPDSVPHAADFAVRIAGDSMEPRYHDDEIVWVHKQNDLEDGEIGIFFLDGNAYLKKFSRKEDALNLISLNPNYDPIEITENSEFQVFGKVVV